MSLSKLELETGINFNEEEDTAIIYTANYKLKKKLDNLCKEYPDNFKRINLVGDTSPIQSYKISKKYVKINAPIKLSDEQRKSRIERGKKLGNFK